MEEKINLEKREKIIKYLSITLVIFTFGLFSNFERITEMFKNEKKPKLNIEYDSNGYIKMINNNGKSFNFDKGRLL